MARRFLSPGRSPVATRSQPQGAVVAILSNEEIKQGSSGGPRQGWDEDLDLELAKTGEAANWGFGGGGRGRVRAAYPPRNREDMGAPTSGGRGRETAAPCSRQGRRTGIWDFEDGREAAVEGFWNRGSRPSSSSLSGREPSEGHRGADLGERGREDGAPCSRPGRRKRIQKFEDGREAAVGGFWNGIRTGSSSLPTQRPSRGMRAPTSCGRVKVDRRGEGG